MDKKSIGKVLFNMREQDELRFVDVDKNKEFEVYECYCHYDNVADKQVVEFLIRETKKNGKHQ